MVKHPLKYLTGPGVSQASTSFPQAQRRVRGGTHSNESSDRIVRHRELFSRSRFDRLLVRSIRFFTVVVCKQDYFLFFHYKNTVQFFPIDSVCPAAISGPAYNYWHRPVLLLLLLLSPHLSVELPGRALPSLSPRSVCFVFNCAMLSTMTIHQLEALLTHEHSSTTITAAKNMSNNNSSSNSSNLQQTLPICHLQYRPSGPRRTYLSTRHHIHTYHSTRMLVFPCRRGTNWWMEATLWHTKASHSLLFSRLYVHCPQRTFLHTISK